MWIVDDDEESVYFPDVGSSSSKRRNCIADATFTKLRRIERGERTFSRMF